MTMRSEAQLVPGLAGTQLGGLAGIVGVVLFVIGVLLSGDAPTIEDSADEIRDWFDANGQQFLVGDFLIALGIVFGLIPFFATLRNVMGQAEGSDSIWHQLGLISGIVWLLVGAAASMFGGALAVAGGQIKDDGAVLALAYASYFGFAGISLVIGLFFLATGIGILRTSLFMRGVGWLCLALAVVSVVAGAGPIEGDPEGVLAWLGLVSTLGLGVVILVLGAALYLRKAGST